MRATNNNALVRSCTASYNLLLHVLLVDVFTEAAQNLSISMIISWHAATERASHAVVDVLYAAFVSSSIQGMTRERKNDLLDELRGDLHVGTSIGRRHLLHRIL